MYKSGIIELLNIKPSPVGGLRFTVALSTSFGKWYFHGYRYFPDGRVVAPSKMYGVRAYRTVVAPKNAHSVIRKLILQAVSESRKSGQQLTENNSCNALTSCGITSVLSSPKKEHSVDKITISSSESELLATVPGSTSRNPADT
jgi:hypothetical protein